MKESKFGPDELKPIADIDRAIHSPARLKILAFLSVVESADFTFLMNQTGLTRGNLSSQGRAAIQAYRENMKQVLDEILAS